MHASLSKAKELGYHNLEAYHAEAFKRNIGFLSRAELASLRHKRIAIPGLGGVGGVHLITMLRTGVYQFNLADFDTFAVANANRQYGAKTSNYGRPKLDVMIDEAKEVNPFVAITPFSEGVDENNVDAFLKDVDLVIDSLDVFAFDFRRLVFNKAREKGIPVITAAPLGFGTSVLAFSGHHGLSFDEYFDVKPNMTDDEKFIHLVVGVAPKALHLKYIDTLEVQPHLGRVPSLGAGCQFAATAVAAMSVSILLNHKGVKYAPYYLSMDPYVQQVKKGNNIGGNKNLFQRMKIKYLLKNIHKLTKIDRDWPLDLPSVKASSDCIPEEVFAYLINAGKAAPSGENTQPWRFSVRENRIHIFLDRNADTSFFNLEQRACLLSCGAAFENMKIAGTAFGLESDIVLYQKMPEDEVGFIAFEHRGKTIDNLHQAIFERHTDRQPYSQKEIEPWVFKEVQQEVDDFGFGEIHWISDKSAKHRLQKCLEILTDVRCEVRQVHEFLHNHIRPNFHTHQDIRTGFPLENLCAGKIGNAFLRFSKPWSRMKIINFLGLGKIIAKKAEEGVMKCGAIGLVTVPDFGEEAYLKGGQLIERVWLKMNKEGLSFQPMTTVNFFDLRIKLLGLDGFEPHLQKRVEKGLKLYYEIFPKINPNGGQIMLFRVGYGKKLRTWTLRKALKDVLLQPIETFRKK